MKGGRHLLYWIPYKKKEPQSLYNPHHITKAIKAPGNRMSPRDVTGN
jgi:hypothetical protein